MENLTTVVFQHVKVNRFALTTKYEKKPDCWSECPPLKNIWNNFGKRKRRGISIKLLARAFKVIAPIIFEKVGGEEAKLVPK